MQRRRHRLVQLLGINQGPTPEHPLRGQLPGCLQPGGRCFIGLGKVDHHPGKIRRLHLRGGRLDGGHYRA